MSDTKTIKPLNPSRLNELSALVGKWADANFDVHLPVLGIFEEIGELAHCFLKRAQKIRGFDDPAKFHAEALDAIADIGIYGLHFAHKNSVEFSEVASSLDEDTETEIIGQLNHLTIRLERFDHSILALFAYLNLVANKLGIDFMQAIEDTWQKVSKRDWKKNPTNANLVSENQ